MTWPREQTTRRASLVSIQLLGAIPIRRTIAPLPLPRRSVLQPGNQDRSKKDFWDKLCDVFETTLDAEGIQSRITQGDIGLA